MITTETERFERVAINVPDKAPSPLSLYSHAIQVGPFVTLSGQGARDPETGKEVGVTLNADGSVASYDITVQTHAVLKNVITVLEAAGCSLKDLIEVNVYLANISDFAAFNKVYAEYFSFENPPARTTIEAHPPGLNFVEIRAVALHPSHRTSG
jgi:2-aminomuconate deaminase